MGKPRYLKRYKIFQKRTILVTEERGFALLFTVLVMAGMLMFAGVVTDFARIYIAREDLQTAVHAGALAGSLQGVRYVQITVRDGYCDICCSDDGCSCCCQCNPSYSVTGTEKYLLDENGWRPGTC